MKRKDLLKKSTEERTKEELDYTLEKDKLQLEADLLETQRDFANAKQKLKALKSEAENFSPAKIVNAMNDVASLEAGLQALNDLKQELF